MADLEVDENELDVVHDGDKDEEKVEDDDPKKETWKANDYGLNIRDKTFKGVQKGWSKLKKYRERSDSTDAEFRAELDRLNKEIIFIDNLPNSKQELLNLHR